MRSRPNWRAHHGDQHRDLHRVAVGDPTRSESTSRRAATSPPASGWPHDGEVGEEHAQRRARHQAVVDAAAAVRVVAQGASGRSP